MNTADELISLVWDTAELTSRDSINLGTLLRPDSVRGIIGQDYLSFVLTTTNLFIFNHRDPSNLHTAGKLELPARSNATAFGCRGNIFFIGATSETGQGIIYSITSL